jgi:hypothetical protein
MPRDFDASLDSPKSARSSGAIVLALIVGLVFGGVFFASFGWLILSRNSGRNWLSHVWSSVTGRTLSIDVSQPTVVDRIHRLQRLETVVYTMDKLVTGREKIPSSRISWLEIVY